MNIVLLWIEAALIAGDAYTRTLERNPYAGSDYILLVSVLTTLIVCGIWVVPNLVYFKHRKYLFSGQENNDVNGSLIPKNMENAERIIGEAGGTAMYCSNCGKPIVDGAKFCRFCGADLLHNLPHLPENPEISSTSAQKPGSPSDANALELDFSILPAPLRRAFYFIEDEEWERASAYLEHILDEEPENPYAYFGRALVECKIASVFHPTAKETSEISTSKNFARALKYADPKTEKIFQQWINN